MRANPQQYLSFLQRLANETKLKRFEVTQTTMDELGGSRGGRCPKIALVTEIDGKPASCGIARDTTAVDAAAYNGKVENQRAQPLANPLRLFAVMARNAIRMEHLQPCKSLVLGDANVSPRASPVRGIIREKPNRR